MLHGYPAPHIGNILVHVVASLLALGAGLVALFSAKGGTRHSAAGRLFVRAYAVVLVTAAVGIVLFQFRSFLAVATVAAAYGVFAGSRALRLRGRRPALIDTVASVLGMAAPVAFMAVVHRLNQPWSPVLTWSVLGGLAGLSAYDLLRHVLPLAYLRRTWVQEHLYKMMGALTALCSTAAATLLPKFQPWAALIPVILGEAVIWSYILVGPRAWTGALPRGPHRGHPTAPPHAIMDSTPHVAVQEST